MVITACRPRTVLRLSLMLALCGAVLFDGVAWGINVALYAAALAGVFAHLRRRAGLARDRFGALLAVALVFWAGVFAWRDAAALHAIAVLGALLTGYLAYLRSGFAALGAVPLGSALAAAGALARSFAWRTPGFVRWELDARTIPAPGRRVLLAPLLRGLALAAPAALVFGALLLSADTRYRAAAQTLLTLDAVPALRHAGAFLACLWLAVFVLLVGVLREGLCPRVAPHAGATRAPGEALTVLAVCNLVFVSYLAVQFGYFFGGAALVRSQAPLTYAEYARGGFFQLVAVAALAVPLLLASDWLTTGARYAVRQAHRWLAAVMILQVTVIQASAMHRMFLYAREFGLTELRFYTSAAMAWITLLLGCVAWAVFRNRRDAFVGAAGGAALAVACALVLVNPHARIADVNLARAASGYALDVDYLLALSADAAPVLVAARGALGHTQRRALEHGLSVHASRVARSRGWRGWNWSRQRALRALTAAGGSVAGP